MSSTKTHIRVLIVDDSELFASALTSILETDLGIRVVGVARTGELAIEQAVQLRPDVITMDVRMPGMGGVKAIERLMATRPTPILVLTDDPRSEDRTWVFECLRRGALDLWPKPALSDTRARQRICDYLKLLATVPVVHHPGWAEPRPAPAPGAGRPAALDRLPGVLGIVASTGGPVVLAETLAALPGTFSLPVLVVQHLAPHFVEDFVAWLGQTTRLKVALASEGALIGPGQVWVAPDDAHMEASPSARLHLDVSTGLHQGHRPSGTVLLRSIAASFGSRGVGLVLTGMGDDGSDGLLELHRAGGVTLAQDAATAAVNGMPQAARDLGAVDIQVSRREIAPALIQVARRLTSNGEGRSGLPGAHRAR